MKLVKIETINYDPDTKTLTFRGINRFSRKKRATLFIDDEPALLQALHKVFANPEGSTLDFSDYVNSSKRVVNKRSSAKGAPTDSKTDL